MILKFETLFSIKLIDMFISYLLIIYQIKYWLES